MPRVYSPYIPQTVGETVDQLGSMMLNAPTFQDRTGYFPEQNIDTEFFALKEGLKVIRKQVGDDNYDALMALVDRMRALFEADPDDKTGETMAGRKLINEMEDILMASARKKR